MIPDPNDEILEIKRRLSAKFDFDVYRIAEDARRRQDESSRKIIPLPLREPEQVEPANLPLDMGGDGNVPGSGESSAAN